MQGRPDGAGGDPGQGTQLIPLTKLRAGGLRRPFFPSSDELAFPLTISARQIGYITARSCAFAPEVV
jgi:hypothetical protein